MVNGLTKEVFLNQSKGYFPFTRLFSQLIFQLISNLNESEDFMNQALFIAITFLLLEIVVTFF